MNSSLEHVLIAARQRRAPVSAETAGYLALAVADALVAAPAQVQPDQVLLAPEGAVQLSSSLRRGDSAAAAQSVRALLLQLLEVAAGSSPSLLACAQQTSRGGVPELIEQLEAALIPVNRDAARRTIGRLARETHRAMESLQDVPPVQVQRRPQPDQVSPPIESAPAGASLPDAAELEAENTEPLAYQPSDPDLQAQQQASLSPEPTVYDPHAAPYGEARATSDASQPQDDGPDRVRELLANFSTAKPKSPRELSGELKKMVGLEPTPAPPPVQLDTSPVPPPQEPSWVPPAPVEFARPRQPKLAFAIVVLVLVVLLCAALFIALYYPSFFTGR